MTEGGESGTLDVYSAKTRPSEDHVPFTGPAGYAGPIPQDADVDADTQTLRTGVDIPLAIERLSRDVYQNQDSAPREDMANEARSASLAVNGHGAAPIIRVVANEDTREFSVQGIDTMGCTWDAFARSLAVIGRTTNIDSGQPGQMGMGFYSNILLSDTILFDSHSRETGERFTAMCKGGTEWQLGLPSAPMPRFGARVSMTVRGNVDMGGIAMMVRKCARLSPCPVHLLDGSGAWKELPMFSSAKSLARWVLYNDMKPSYGAEDRPPLPEAFGSAMRKAGIDGVLYLHGERDGVEVCAAFVTKINTVRINGKSVRARAIDGECHDMVAHLVGMPIRLRYYARVDTAFNQARLIVVSVKDERKYKPTADRERFTADAENRICDAIDAVLTEQMASVRCAGTLAEHLRSPYRAAVDAAIDSGADMGTYKTAMAVEPIGADAEYVARLGRTRVRNGFDRKLVPLYHAVFAHPRSVLASKADARTILAVARHDPSMRVIVSGKADELAGSGLERIEAYMERVGIRPLTAPELDEYAKSEEWERIRALYGVHDANDSRTRSPACRAVYTVVGSPIRGNAALLRRHSLSVLDKDSEVVAAGTHLGAIVGAMLASDTDFAVARLEGRDGSGRLRRHGREDAEYAERMSAPSGAKIIAEADLLDSAAKTEFHTSCGTMTGEEIAGHSGRIAILQCADAVSERLAAAISRSSWFGRPGTVYVACGGNRHFVLLSLLGSIGGGRGKHACAAADVPPLTGRIFRVVALRDIPKGEMRKVMVAAGTPITLADEIGECGDTQRAGIVCRTSREWATQMDLLLAALELDGTDILRALAGSARGIEWCGGLRIRDILDDAIAAEKAHGAASARAPEPQPGYVADVPRGAIEASDKLLARAKKWIMSTEAKINGDSLRRITTAEVGGRAAGASYHTNNGPLTTEAIVEAALAAAEAYSGRRPVYGADDEDGMEVRRHAAAIVVYDRDAPGLAAAIPADKKKTVAVVETVDEALELACAIAAHSGLKCRIGGDGCDETRYIMGFADTDATLGDVSALEHVNYGWKEYPAVWHGMLAVRNTALKNMLAATLGHSGFDWSAVQTVGAIVERFLWLDGQGGRTAGTAVCDAAAGTAAARRTINDTVALGRSLGADKKR